MMTPQVEETPENKGHKNKLMVLFVVGLILTVFKFIIHPSIGISDLLQAFLLLFGAICMNYCLIVFYVIFVLFNTASLMRFVGIKI